MDSVCAHILFDVFDWAAFGENLFPKREWLERKNLAISTSDLILNEQASAEELEWTGVLN
jgi:hypothetical protein